MKTDVARDPAQVDGDATPAPRIGLRDAPFFGLFVLFFIGAVVTLALGTGAVLASRFPGLHESFHLNGDFATTMLARAYKRMADESHVLPSAWLTALGFGFSFFNLALAVFLLWLRPRDRTARLLAVGMVGTAGVFNLTSQATLEVLAMTPIESVVQALAHIITGLSYAYALVLFPDGRAVPRWRTPALAVLYLPATVAAVFLAVRVQGTARPGALLVFFGLVVPIAGVLAQAYRFRSSDSSAQHQQARLLFWALLPALGVGIWFVTVQGFGAFTAPALAGRHLPEQPVTVFRIFQPVFLLVPIALFVGLLRYRLWDIDRVINRTLVYGLLTASLGGAYFGIVALLQRIFIPLTRGSGLAVAMSTLVVAAAFLPARRWVQDFVDRRFYRQRYDAQRTIEAFNSRLRDQLDLESLTSELRSAVAETVQPESVSLLLRGPSGGQAWQWTFRPRGRP